MLSHGRGASTRWLACSLLGLSACSGPPGSPPPGGSGALTALALMPEHPTLVVDNGAAAVQPFRAMGTFADGHLGDVTDRVVFHVGDSALGRFSGNNFTSTTSRGGATTVTAAVDKLSATTPLTLVLKERISDPSAPSGASGAFAGPIDSVHAPAIVYPPDGVVIPPNLGTLEIHFIPGAGETMFEIAFTNGVTDVRVYTACTPVGTGCVYSPDARVFSFVAETNRGQSVGVQVSGVARAGDPVGTTPATNVAFSADDILGAVYYWAIAPSGDTAIMRFDFAARNPAERFAGPNLAGGTCIGCHALSHDGNRLVAEAGGQTDGRVLLMDVARKTPMVPFASTPRSIFESFSPDGTRFVGVNDLDGDYNLRLHDGATGAFVADILGTGTALHPADHPDWSPDGRSIAYVQVGIPNTLQQMYRGGIFVVVTNAGGWSAPLAVVPPQDGKNRYYPAFAPDSAFLVYDESTCPAGTSMADACNADTNPSARLWAVEPRAGARPVELARANTPGALDGGITELTNSFPKWSPFVFRRTGEFGSRLMWLTFASKRAPGLRTAPTSARGGRGTLLWMVAVDPDRVLTGQDPSAPAFVLPFQDFTTSNHIAQWTTKVVAPIQ